MASLDENIRTDDCKSLMRYFLDRLVRDSAGDADPQEVEAAREFIVEGQIQDEEKTSPFCFEQALEYVGLSYEMIQPVFNDFRLIGWRKNSIIFMVLLGIINKK